MNKTEKLILTKILEEISISTAILSGVSFDEFDSNEEKKRAVAIDIGPYDLM